MADVAKRIFFSGRVQGIGFRFTSQTIACRYALCGFVRNLPDGRVELLLQGDEEDVENCISDIRESFSSNIRNMQIENEELSQQYDDFRISL